MAVIVLFIKLSDIQIYHFIIIKINGIKNHTWFPKSFHSENFYKLKTCTSLNF